MGEIAPNALSLPYALVAVGLISLMGAALVARGRTSVRLAMAAVAGASLPWAVANAALASVDSHHTALIISRIFVGTLPLIGAAGLFATLSISGRLYRHRRLAVAAAVVSVAAVWPAVATDLVVRDVAVTAWGIFYPRAGLLNEVYVGSFILGLLAGIAIGMRMAKTSSGARWRRESRRITLTMSLILPCAADLLLAHGIGVYPLSFAPALIAIARQWYWILRRDLLRTTGIDTRAITHAVLLAAAAALLAVAITAAGRLGLSLSALSVALAAVPLLAGAQFLASRIARHLERNAPADVDVALGELFALATDVRDEDELAGAVAEVLDLYLDLRPTRLLIAGGDGFVTAGAPDEPPRRIDDRVRAWLAANSMPAVADDLSAAQVGALAAPIRGFFSAVHADVALPVLDRDRLIGVVIASTPAHRRALNHVEQAALLQVQDAVSQALAFLSLTREVRTKVELSREVEVATAVQAVTSPGEHRAVAGGFEVTTCYQPATDFGGDFWVVTPIADDRVLVAIGDVAGRGMPAALISTAVVGACETACRMHGAALTLSALFDALNRLVLDVGQQRHAMSCFAGIWNTADGSVSFASAGHPFPYVLSGAGLSSLISRGMPFGVEPNPRVDVVTRPFSTADVAVLYTNALMDIRNSEDRAYGPRRLRRVLGGRFAGAGAGGCAMIMDDALMFRGPAPARDDITIVTVRRAPG